MNANFGYQYTVEEHKWVWYEAQSEVNHTFKRSLKIMGRLEFYMRVSETLEDT